METTIKFRIPSWLRNMPIPSNLYQYKNKTTVAPTITLNGEIVDSAILDGYFILKKIWKKGDLVELNFPMPMRMVEADEKVAEDQGKVSLERGPLVYAVEEIDNKNIFDEIKISSIDGFSVEEKPNLLGGVFVLKNENITAIPYYAWSNRGVGKMKVWMDFVNY